MPEFHVVFEQDVAGPVLSCRFRYESHGMAIYKKTGEDSPVFSLEN
jgi:hypothetical protein